MITLLNRIPTKHHREILLVLCFLFVNCFIMSLYYVFNAPHDYLQGIYAKIMYIHVPSAWLSMGLYFAVASFSIGYYLIKNPIFFLYAKSIAPVGCTLTLITLITGSIWGKPTWGTWWVWDARLTSMLILFFIYVGYIGLVKSFEDGRRAAIVSSTFAIVGLINIPIIKFSVDIWNTLHQPSSILKFSGPAIHLDMLIPLVLSAISLLIFSCILVLLRVRIEYWIYRTNRIVYSSKKEIYS